MPDSSLRQVVRRGLVTVLLVAGHWSLPLEAHATACPDGAEAAAVSAVRASFGPEAEPVLSQVVCERTPSTARATLAVPEPGSRTDGPVRFVLYRADGAVRTRAGRLTAVVGVSAPHVRTVSALAAGTTLDESAVVSRVGPVGRVAFGTLPSLDQVVGQRLRRPADADTVLTTLVVERRALVRSGTDVVTVARIDGLEVRGRAVAAQNGDLGDLVVVVNPDSKKRLRGRVVAPATVEVLHVS